MSTILESDETGTLHLPPSLLPQPGPHRRYRVAAENGHVVVDKAPAAAARDAASEWPSGYFEQTAGALADEPFERPVQGAAEQRENW